MHLKYYSTDWEKDNTDASCRFNLLTTMIANDIPSFFGLKPRMLHVADKSYCGFVKVVAIVVWE